MMIFHSYVSLREGNSPEKSNMEPRCIAIQQDGRMDVTMPVRSPGLINNV